MGDKHLNIDSKIINQTLKQYIPNLKAIYIFGSFAQNQQNSSSDLDIAILADKKLNNIKRWEIATKLANKLNIDIDLVDLLEANTILKFQIISKGKRIYGEGFEIEKFEMIAISQYQNFIAERQPIVDEILKNKSILGKINE